jgi:hypothetical protein
MLEESGVYVVIEPGYGSNYDDVIGVAATLTGAMRLVLATETLEMLVPENDPEDPEACKAIPVMVDTVGAADAFRWVDENAIGYRPGGFKLGEGFMRAYFQDEATRYVVQWRQMTF